MLSSVAEPAAITPTTAPPAPALRLIGARVAVDIHTALRSDIEIEMGRIRSLAFEGVKTQHDAEPRPGLEPLTVDLAGFLILPGLINAHDHLEFNLFPRLGNGPYQNFKQWAQDIYHPDRPPLREHLAVPKPVRLWWGGIKNLLSGVTTVCHHNPYEPEIFGKDFPVRVVRQYGWAHSIPLEKDIQRAFRAAPPHAPFVIHLGEGTDEESRNEIFELDRLGALDARTVIVHGVALNAAGHALLRQRGGALVWCPTSNLFTLGTTLDRHTLSETRRVVLGSDSALTAQGDLLDEIRVAHLRMGVKAGTIYEMVTRRAAEVFRLAQGEGCLNPGAVADLIAIPDPGGSPASALVESSFRQIELVILAGRPHLLSPRMSKNWPKEFLPSLASIQVENIERLIRAPLALLSDETRRHLGAQFRLAGKRVSV